MEDLIKSCLKRAATEKTADTYRTGVNHFVRYLADQGISLEDVRTKDAEAFKNKMASRYVPNSTNTYVAGARYLCEEAVERGLLEYNPFDQIGRESIEPSSPNQLTTRDLLEVLAWVDRKPEHVKMAFYAMWATGLRLGEVVALRASDIVVLNGAYWVQVKGRFAPIVHAKAARMLADYAARADKHSTLFKITANTLLWHARECRLDTGINFRTRCFRDTFGVSLADRGVEIHTLQEALRLKSIVSAERYIATPSPDVAALAVH